MASRGALSSIRPDGLDDTMHFGMDGRKPTGDLTDALIDVPDGEGERVDDAVITESDDGGVEVAIGDGVSDIERDMVAASHDGNLALVVSESESMKIANELIDAVEMDIKSREEWEQAYLKGMDLLGVRMEDRVYPFKGACGVSDPLLSEALIRFQASARSELLPATGPVKTQVVGDESEEKLAQADRVKSWMNYYLTEGAPEWYDDFDQMLWWIGLAGSTFKKTYQDPILRRPVSPFIMPDDFVVSYTTTSLATCPRATHIQWTSKREMALLKMSGYYRDVSLVEPDEKQDMSTIQQQIDAQQGLTAELADGDDRYKVYECHVDYDLEGFEHKDDKGKKTGFPLPYVISIEVQSRKVLSIRRNWNEGDKNYRKREYFTHYKFLPGPGFYGYGMSHVLGNSARARQLVDAGTLSNFPGGLRVKGMRIEDNNLAVGPTEFREIDTGGLPIQNAVMPLPYKEPSATLFQMRESIRQGADRLAGTMEIAVGDGRQDAPVGTTVALLEAATKIQSGVMKRLYLAMKREFRLIAKLFGKHLPAAPYPYAVPGASTAIMKQDFNHLVDVIPVADPNVTSSSQRMLKAEALLRMAQSNPQLHDLREAYRRMYMEMGVTNIDKLMPVPQEAVPLDPLSEERNLLAGKPVKAGQEQNHQAHIASHVAFKRTLMAQAVGMADAAPTNLQGTMQALDAHITEHMAMMYRQQIQQQLPGPLPPEGQPLPPQIEFMLSGAIAKASQAIMPPSPADAQDAQLKQVLAVEEHKTAAKIEAAKIAADAKVTVETLKTAADVNRDRADTANASAEAKLRAAVDVIVAMIKEGAGVQSSVQSAATKAVSDIVGHAASVQAEKHKAIGNAAGQIGAAEHAATGQVGAAMVKPPKPSAPKKKDKTNG
jgi:hypothetical protein